MCYIEYPNTATLGTGTNTNPVGLINWGSMRMCQMLYSRWSTIEPNADGNYVWANLDSIITFQRQNGKSVYFGVYGIPLGYANNSDVNPAYTDAVTKEPWGVLGGAGYPAVAGKNSSSRDGMTALTAYVTAVMTRYNSPSGTWVLANPTLGKGIQYWEPWNEPGQPNWTGGNAATSSGQRVSSFCWMTVAQHVDFTYAQRVSVKAIDNSVVFTSPGFGGLTPSTNIGPFLAASGIINSAVTGAQCIDALVWHPYSHNPPYVVFEAINNDILMGTSGIQTMKGWMLSKGYNFPLWIGEWGVDAGAATQTEIHWYAAPASFRYTWIARFLMTCAAEGVQCVHPWNWQETGTSSGNSGDWQLDVDGVQKAYNDFATKVSGKTIISGTYGVPGPVYLYFSDVPSWTV